MAAAVGSSIEQLESRVLFTTLYWDPSGASTAVGGTGTWNTTTAAWRSGSPTGPLVAWTNSASNTAVFPASGGTVTLGTGITLTFGTGTSNIDVPSGASATISSAIAGSGAILTKIDTGTLTLSSGSNTYSGGTVVSDGQLTAGVNNAFGTSSALTTANVSTASVNLNGKNVAFGSLSGGGSSGGNITGLTGTLTIGAANTSTSYAGSISSGSGSGTLTKTGTGTQTLIGTSNIGGSGTVNLTGGGITLSGGGTFTDNNLYVSTATGQNNLALTVTGSGTSWTNGGNVAIGEKGTGNSLTVNTGASFSAYLFWISGGPGNPTGSSANSVTVTDTGSYLHVIGSNNWDIADRGTGSSFSVLNGATATMAGAGYLGYYSGANSNSITVSGAGSTWNIGGLNTAYSAVGSNNSITVSGGGTIADTGGMNLGGGSGGAANTTLSIDATSSVSTTGFSMISSSTLSVGINSTSQYGKLAVKGNVTLAGALSLSGTQSSGTDAQYQIITSTGTVTGTLTGGTSLNSIGYTPVYGPSGGFGYGVSLVTGSPQNYVVTLGSVINGAHGFIDTSYLSLTCPNVPADTPDQAIANAITGTIYTNRGGSPQTPITYAFPEALGSDPTAPVVIRNDMGTDGVAIAPWEMGLNVNTAGAGVPQSYWGYLGFNDNNGLSGNDSDYNDLLWYVTVTPAPVCSTCGCGGVQQTTGASVTSTSGLSSGGSSASFASGIDMTSGPNSAYSGSSGVAGPGTMLAGVSSLTKVGNGVLGIVDGPTSMRYFTPTGTGSYTESFGGTDTLTANTMLAEYILTGSDGTVSVYNDFTTGTLSGRLKTMQDATGNVSTYSYDTSGKLTSVARSTTTGGTTTDEQFAYNYFTSGASAGLLSSIVLQRQVAGGGYAEVQETDYTYYVSGDAHGNPGQLKTVTLKDAGGAVTSVNAYRYYTGETGGPVGSLKYMLGDQSYARLAASLSSGTTPLTATDSQVAPYADEYYTYDTQGRVTSQVLQGQGCSSCSGGLGTFAFSYANATNIGGDYNSWTNKTVETLPDGTVDTYYYNGYGQQMLTVTTDGITGLSYGNFTEYDSAGRTILTADPAAVQLPSSLSTLEAYPDLLHKVSGNYQYLADSAGQITLTDYYSTTTATSSTAGGVASYEQDTKIQLGETGTAILQSSMDYFARTGGGATTYPIADDTSYGGTGGTDARTTSYAYTWYSGTTQMQSQTVTMPVISSGQNGPGVADTNSTFYDTYGRPIWTMDGNGNVSFTAYDDATGATVESISSVDYASLTSAQQTSFAATGWSHPTGLNLVTTYVVDDQGRTTKITSPNGNVTYTVYDDADREVRTYPGFDAGTGTTTGPIQITRTYLPAANSGGIFYTESMTSSATPHLTAGVPDGTETLDSSNIQSLSRQFTNAAGQTIWSDSFVNLTGVTFSEGVVLSGGVPADLGTNGTNYYRTTFGYDDAGRQNHVVEPTGTITDTLFDGLGQQMQTWIGTDDVPTTDLNGDGTIDYEDFTDTIAAGGSAPAGTNMVKVARNIYDNGGVGDGNLTESIRYPGGSAASRATLNYYDWRNRLVASKQGALVNSSDVPTPSAETNGVHRPISYVTYDNAGEATEQQMFDGDGVTITTTAGVPNAPTSLLTAESTQSYDDQGRVYASTTYGVDPTTGSVGSGITTNRFFDHNGNTIATFTPGHATAKTMYDGANRVITSYMTDGGAVNNSGSPLLDWTDAWSVANDVVVSETDMTYDADGNALLTTQLDRLPTASTTTVGALTSSLARISYVGGYYDAADRTIAVENVGTNGGSTWTRPSTPDTGDDTHLVTTTAYNAQGLPYLVTDPRGIESETLYDLLGRQTTTIAAFTGGTPTNDTNQTTEYTYDGNNDVLTMTAVMPTGTPSQTTQYLYGQAGTGILNDNNLLIGTQYPDPTTGYPSGTYEESFGYDNLGEKTSMSDQNGSHHVYTYDSLGRMTLDAVTMLATGVDSSVMALGYNYNAQGLPNQQTSYSDAAGTTVVNQDQDVYNGFQQLTGEYQAVSGTVNTSTTPEVQYAYSSAATGSNPTEMIYPNGRILHYGYDNNSLDTAIGRVDYLADDNGSGGVGSHLADYGYLGLGSILSQADGNGVTLTTTLDQFGRVQEMNWVNTSTSTSTDDFQYGYDRNGNVLYKKNATSTADNSSNFSELYSYDNLNRLTSYQRGTLSSDNTSIVTDNTLPGSSQIWALDAVGNQTSTTTDGTAVDKTSNSRNQLTNVGSNTLTYDNNGNTTTDASGNTLTYDAWNRMVNDSAGTTSYTFDANGRRITETHGGTTTDLYFTTQGQVIEERDAGTGSVTAQNVWSIDYVNDLLERDSGVGLATRVYYQHDANYNVTATVDAGGSLINWFVYTPYGQPTVLEQNPTTGDWVTSSAANSIYGFQGGRFDIATGLNRFGARDYNPATGTWMEPDPAGYVDGMNDYQGFQIDPILGSDPSGTKTILVQIGPRLRFGDDSVGNIAVQAYKSLLQKPLSQIKAFTNTTKCYAIVVNGEPLRGGA